MSRARLRGLDRVDRVPALRLVSGAVPSTPEALIEQAEGAEGDERWELARELYERALHRLNPGAHAALASSLLLAIGRTHHATGNADAALDCVEAALTAATGQDDATSAGYALNLRALVHWELGEFDAAEREHGEARALALRAGDARLAAIAERHLGALAMLRGDLDDAARHYETSVAELRAIGDAADLCAALGALGDVFGDQERWELADRTLGEAAQIGSVLGDLDILLGVELRRAESWLARGELDLARQSHDRVAELARRLRDPGANVRLTRLAGVLARELGETDRAESLLADAERAASERHDLLLAAEAARERAELLRRQERHRDTLQALNRAYRLLAQVRGRSSAVEVARRAARLERDFLDVVRRWGQSIEAKDLNTHGHCERVADLACAIAERMGVDRRSLFWYRVGALLHDVGKLVVPPEVLNKPGRLTESEWSLVKRHPVAGAEMLHGVDFPWEVRPIVESHHECWDGSGYPHGLLGEATPLSARIVCVADVYDVLTSARSFKRALAHDEAMVVMRRDVGRQFDPAVFRVFEEVISERAGAPVVATPVAAPDDPPASREDALTGTLQRSAFFAAATAALAERRGSARTVSLLLVDIDDLGHVNESYGRAQGDDVLWAVSQVLQHGLRSGDLVGRHGADEFAVLLPDASIEKAGEVAQRIVEAVGRLAIRLRDTEETTLQVSVSVGCATAPRHGDTSAMLVAAADRALYEARGRGPAAVVSAAENAPVAPAARLVFDRFVGRTAELRRLAHALDTSARGIPQVVTISGEAGVGKSTLLQQLMPEVRLHAALLAVGQSRAGGLHAPYAPWADLLAAIDAEGLVPARVWRELPRLVPALGGAPPSDGGHRLQLFDEIAAYVAEASRARPLVLVFEDAHWADAGTWDVLEHLVTSLQGARVMICLTIRADEARGIAERRRRLSRLASVDQIALQRLSREDVKRWLETVFHQGDIGTELPAFLHEHTEGNPLFVQQVLRTLADDGGIWYAGTRWEWRPVAELRLPPSAAGLIERRLERLSPRARGVLAAAAVIGERFDSGLLLACGAGSVNEIAAATAEAQSAGVIERADGGDDAWAFRHALLADAARHLLPERQLQRLHDALAHALELRRPSAVADIARHYHAAGNDDKAYAYALLAADRAASVYAHEDAASSLLVAQRHAPSPEALADARVRLARVAEAAGRYAQAEEMCDLALEFLSSRAEPARSLPVRRMRERLRLLRGEPVARVYDACRALLVEAESLGEREECAWLLIMMSQHRVRMLDPENSERLARRAVGVAETLPERGAHAESLLRLGAALMAVHPAESVECFRDSLATFSRLQDRHGQVRCWLQMAVAHMRAGYLVPAGEACEAALTLARQAHAPDLAGLAALNLGVVAWRGGDYALAAEHLEAAERLFVTVQHAPFALSVRLVRAHLARDRGDADEALRRYDDAADAARALGQRDTELAAEAGAGLVRLARSSDDAFERWRRVSTGLPDGSGDLWFNGREIVDALIVRLALRAGREQLAIDAFEQAVARASRRDAWAAAWLVAECAEPLTQAGFVSVDDAVARFSARAEASGFAALAARFTHLRQRFFGMRGEKPSIPSAADEPHAPDAE